MELAHQGKVRIDSERFPLEDVNDVYQEIKRRQDPRPGSSDPEPLTEKTACAASRPSGWLAHCVPTRGTND